ncbi:MAG: GNAT family N-acetyltransferase [Phycisphaeraceae bacterium]|nr:GNAT family N-acetyltransferase [Phycisphaeraceae bacterium]
MICLDEMDDAAFAQFLDHLAKAKSQGSTEDGASREEVIATARQSLNARFSDANFSSGNVLLSIKETSSGEVVGHIWIALHSDDSLPRGALHSFTVYERFRRKGYGREAMSLLVPYARARGWSSLVLWIAGSNDTGRSFCENAGFAVVGSFMRKDITAALVSERITLECMNPEMIRTFVEDQVQRYAERTMRDLGIPKQQALQGARCEFERFTGGVVPEGEHILVIMDAFTGIALGHLWYSIHQEGPVQTAFIEDILIRDPHRGKGLGYHALVALERHAQQAGATGICLFVQAHNEPARRLYSKRGFSVGNTEMERSLVAASIDDASRDKQDR